MKAQKCCETLPWKWYHDFHDANICVFTTRRPSEYSSGENKFVKISGLLHELLVKCVLQQSHNYRHTLVSQTLGDYSQGSVEKISELLIGVN